MATSSNKNKSTAKENATARVAERRGSGGASKMPASEKQRSQSRYPGETPLTGEDRPKNRPTRKIQGRIS